MKQHRFWAYAAVVCFVMLFYTGMNIQFTRKENRFVCRRSSLWNGGGENSFQPRRKEDLRTLYGGSPPSQGLCDEDCYHSSGECGGYSCRS